MSASLVGSEMCIRDSPNHRREPWGGAALRKVHPGLGTEHAGLCEHVGRSVSYTHLTLPTICSV
eukprot:13844614-Alexandrium_andersonii.AAC.1